MSLWDTVRGIKTPPETGLTADKIAMVYAKRIYSDIEQYNRNQGATNRDEFGKRLPVNEEDVINLIKGGIMHALGGVKDALLNQVEKAPMPVEIQRAFTPPKTNPASMPPIDTSHEPEPEREVSPVVALSSMLLEERQRETLPKKHIVMVIDGDDPLFQDIIRRVSG